MTFLKKLIIGKQELDPLYVHSEEVKNELQKGFPDLDKAVDGRALGMFHFPIKDTENGALFVNISYTGGTGKPKRYLAWLQKLQKGSDDRTQVTLEAHDLNGLKENVKKLLNKVKQMGRLF